MYGLVWKHNFHIVFHKTLIFLLSVICMLLALKYLSYKSNKNKTSKFFLFYP
jgi:hypothetical protein